MPQARPESFVNLRRLPSSELPAVHVGSATQNSNTYSFVQLVTRLLSGPALRTIARPRRLPSDPAHGRLSADTAPARRAVAGPIAPEPRAVFLSLEECQFC
jgi:hypothetical protein